MAKGRRRVAPVACVFLVPVIAAIGFFYCKGRCIVQRRHFWSLSFLFLFLLLLLFLPAHQTSFWPIARLLVFYHAACGRAIRLWTSTQPSASSFPRTMKRRRLRHSCVTSSAAVRTHYVK